MGYEQPKKRAWFQFSLSTMVMFVLILGGWLGIGVWLYLEGISEITPAEYAILGVAAFGMVFCTILYNKDSIQEHKRRDREL